MNLILISFAILTIHTSAIAMAAIPIEQAAVEKKNHYLKEGVFVGGLDQGVMTLTNVRHSYDAQTHLERLVLDLAPAGKMSGLQRPGFFHVAVQKNGQTRRLVVDLAHCADAKVTQNQVTEILSRSKYFSIARFVPDLEHQTLTIELPMKAFAEIEVFELASQEKPGRIVIDAKGL